MQVLRGHIVKIFQLLRGGFSVLFEVYQFMQRRSADRTAVVRYTALAIGAVQVTRPLPLTLLAGKETEIIELVHMET